MMKFPLLFQSPPRDSESGGGAAPHSSGAAPAGGGSASPPPVFSNGSPPASAPGQPGGGGSGAPAGAPWAMPEGFPDRLKAANAEEFHAKLADDWKAQRKQISELPAPGKEPGDYKFEPGEKLAKFVGDLAQDKTFAAAQKAALAAGISPGAFQTLVGGFYESLVEAGALSPPIDVRGEALKFLGKGADAPLDEKQALAELAPKVEPLMRFIDKVVADGKLGKEHHAALYGLMDTAAGMQAVAALAQATQTPGMQTGGVSGGQTAITKEALQQRIMDPRNQYGSPTWDPAFQKETSELYAQVYGSGQ